MSLVGTVTGFPSRIALCKNWEYVPSPYVYNVALTEQPKQQKKDPVTLPAHTIRSAAHATATREIASQKEQFRQLGIMADWSTDSTYRTLGMSICATSARLPYIATQTTPTKSDNYEYSKKWSREV
jgi:hypothetical protein